MEQTTVVTDADGNIVSKSVKEIPFSSSAEGSSFGATQGSKEGLSSMINQYASNRYGANRYANMEAALSVGDSSSLSVEA